MHLYLCQFGNKKLTTTNTFVHHAESVDECIPCSFSEEVEHDILSSRFDRFHDVVAPLVVQVLVYSQVFDNISRLMRFVILVGMFMILWLKLVNQII